MSTPGEDGWTSVALEKSDRDSTETLRVYTDIDVPTYVSLVDVQDGDNGEFQVSSGTDVGKLGAALPEEAKIAPLRAAAEADLTVTDPTVGESREVSGTSRWTFDGTFDGAPGTFVCVGPNCMVMTIMYAAATDDKEEMVSLDPGGANGDWYFQPDDADVEVAVPDADYLAFGAWTDTPDDIEDDDYSFMTFYYGNDPIDVDTITALLGTGTYEGPAAGSYATTNAIAGTAESGEFVAKAHLEANFDEFMIPEGLGGESIWGEITDFMVNDESLGNWRVDLGSSLMGNDGTFKGITGLDIGNLELDNVDTVGSWNGQFYGNPSSKAYNAGKDATAEDEQKAAAQPGGVAGEFTAQFGSEDNAVASAIIVGAFGATRVSD